MEIKMTTRPAAAPAGSLLRASVLLDVAVSGTSAAATLLTAGRWDSWFGVPTGWAIGLGVFFVAWTLTCAAVARRPVPRVVAVLGAANLGYALVSVLAGVEQVWPLTGWGEAVLVAQTLGVAGIGAFQLYATRR